MAHHSRLVFAILVAPLSATANPSILDGTLGDEGAGPEIGTTELRAALADPRAVVLDARAPEEFAVSHIPGALNVAGKPGTTAALYISDVNDVVKLIPERTRLVVLYCNGPYCGRSKRLAAELVQVGYTRVRRYQLGIPTWRALGGVTQVERDALLSLLARDGTAVLVDARPSGSAQPALPRARSIPLADTAKAKDDGRLPMTDHNTRIFVVGRDGPEARAVAEALARDAFHNVAFYGGSAAELTELLR
jgi:rhodanese-related sulfurtransferase